MGPLDSLDSAESRKTTRDSARPTNQRTNAKSKLFFCVRSIQMPKGDRPTGVKIQPLELCEMHIPVIPLIRGTSGAKAFAAPLTAEEEEAAKKKKTTTTKKKVVGRRPQ